MTTETKETFTFGYEELRAFIALCFTRGVITTIDENVKPEEGRMLLEKTVHEMIKLKREHDNGKT